MSSDEATQRPAEPSMLLRKVYLKDLSFESPNVPDIFDGRWGDRQIRPTMKINVLKSHTALKGGEHELVLRVTVHALLEDDSTLFLVETTQAGIFWLADDVAESLDRVIHLQCFRALYPFAREAIWTVANRGGVGPLLLQDINFEELYEQV